MEIRLAKTAGFCFGVDRAVKLTYGLLDEGRKVATLGPLIHNPQTVENLERPGRTGSRHPRGCPCRLRGGHPQPRRPTQHLR